MDGPVPFQYAATAYAEDMRLERHRG
jgi:hypothetical protein